MPRFFDASTLVNDIRGGQSSLKACSEAGQALLDEQRSAPAQTLPLCDGPQRDSGDELLGQDRGGEPADELLGSVPAKPAVPYRIVRFAPQQLKSDGAVRSAWKAALADVPDTDGSKTAFLHWLPSFLKRCWDTDRLMCAGSDYEHFIVGQLRRVQHKTSEQRQQWLKVRLEIMGRQIARGTSRPPPWEKNASGSKRFKGV